MTKDKNYKYNDKKNMLVILMILIQYQPVKEVHFSWAPGHEQWTPAAAGNCLPEATHTHTHTEDARSF
jgi:hypothetical protein